MSGDGPRLNLATQVAPRLNRVVPVPGLTLIFSSSFQERRD